MCFAAPKAGPIRGRHRGDRSAVRWTVVTLRDTTDDVATARRARVAVSRLSVSAGLLDALAILVFVTIGRSSHEEGITIAGVASTAWPFLIGAIVGWLVARVWQRPISLAPGALAVWLGSFAVGMALRVVSGQGTAVSFMIVACSFLAATLFGWRVVAARIVSLQQRRARGRTTP